MSSQASLLQRFPFPSYESLDRLVFCQAKLVVKFGRVAIAVFGALPEFAWVGAREKGFVLLALVLENRQALTGDFIGAEGDGHFDLVNAPLHPSAAVEPDFAVFH